MVVKDQVGTRTYSHPLERRLDELERKRKRILDAREEQDDALREGWNAIRVATQEIAAEKWPSLESFFADVVAAATARGLGVTSRYTVRNNLRPNRPVNEALVTLSARIALAGPGAEEEEA